MPFSLTNASANFQCLINHAFKDFLRKFILVFFDDNLIYSHNMKQHLCHLQYILLVVLQQRSLFVKISNCRFPVLEIDYLSHIMSGDGVKADPSKLQSMLEWPTPKIVKSLRGFLRLTGYYRKLI